MGILLDSMLSFYKDKNQNSGHISRTSTQGKKTHTFVLGLLSLALEVAYFQSFIPFQTLYYILQFVKPFIARYRTSLVVYSGAFCLVYSLTMGPRLY